MRNCLINSAQSNVWLTTPNTKHGPYLDGNFAILAAELKDRIIVIRTTFSNYICFQLQFIPHSYKET